LKPKAQRKEKNSKTAEFPSMSSPAPHTQGDFLRRLKWIMFFRVLFTTLLLGSTIVFEVRKSPSPSPEPLFFIFALVIAIYILTLAYSIVLHRFNPGIRFAYIQIGIDTLIVTFIIYVTGGFSSIFSFLYLVVIVYASLLLSRGGSMIMASLCSIQYGILVDLEYFDILVPVVMEETISNLNYTWNYVIFKIMITMLACFAVAFLSSLLSEQERRTRKDLLAMEANVKRVERMAAVGEMAAGLAHEIKNPLASLTGSIQVLLEDLPCSPDQGKLMQIVLREADRLTTLVDDFLLFAKPPSGKKEKIELGSAIADTLELFEKDDIGRNRITIRRSFLPDVWVEMDVSHLRQILWNLLLNASEAISSHGPDGRIDVGMLPSSDKNICIQISDTGCGIPKEVLGSIYDPFFTTKPSGTGLGLSIVHRILESYQGWIEVQSEVGRGTTFTVKLKQTCPPARLSGKERPIHSL